MIRILATGPGVIGNSDVSSRLPAFFALAFFICHGHLLLVEWFNATRPIDLFVAHEQYILGFKVYQPRQKVNTGITQCPKIDPGRSR